jgi:hypothetical protein
VKDLFGAPKINGHHYLDDPFRWCVAIFATDGAVEVIKRANETDLKSFYPIRQNIRGEYKPLWANYLFIQFIETVTIDLCRSTTKFIKVISAHDQEGLLKPVLVRRNGVQESMAMVLQGKYNERMINRRFYGRGTIALVLRGHLLIKK